MTRALLVALWVAIGAATWGAAFAHDGVSFFVASGAFMTGLLATALLAAAGVLAA